MKKAHIIINLLVIVFLFITVNGCVGNDTQDEALISDMLLYEHDNSDFYLNVSFIDDSFDTIRIWIVDSMGFSVKDEPDPVYCSMIKDIKVDFISLPLQAITNECKIIRNAETLGKPWEVDFQKHDLYILNDEYRLYQYLEWNNSSTYHTNAFWQLMYEADKETQAKILEYADYDNRKDGYKFGPLYHATAEGQIQCIYKYGNKVYYRQIN